MKLKDTVLFISILLAGVIIPFGFAPFNIWSLVILSPAFLLWVWQHPTLTPSPFKAFQYGLVYGLGMFGTGISWVFVSIHRYGNTEAPVAVLLTLLFILALSFFIAMVGFCIKRFFKGSPLTLCVLGFPCLWVLFEWLRSVLLSGFPWLLLGNAELHSPLSGFAPIGSVYAVSLVTLITSGSVIAFIKGTPKVKLWIAIFVVILWGSGEGLRHTAWTTPFGKEYSVSLVQGNISPIDKFVQGNPIQVARTIYGKLTEPHWGSDFIIWPENAIAYPLPQVEPFLNELKNRATAHHTTLITGLQTIVNHSDYYNSMAMLGKESHLYHKRHLVPFGEFLPLDSLLRGLINFLDIPMSNFIEGPQTQNLFTYNDDLKISPMICYEIAYPTLVRESLKEAGVIITLSEDGWFGNSWGPHQHLQIAQMRALETGRPIVRATTCGISAVIDEKGRVTASSVQFKPLVLNATFKATQGTTPWVRFGLTPFLVLLIAGFILPGRLKTLLKTRLNFKK